MKSVFDLIDTFQSRIKDMERQKKEGIVCKEDKKQSLEFPNSVGVVNEKEYGSVILKC